MKIAPLHFIEIFHFNDHFRLLYFLPRFYNLTNIPNILAFVL